MLLMMSATSSTIEGPPAAAAARVLGAAPTGPHAAPWPLGSVLPPADRPPTADGMAAHPPAPPPLRALAAEPGRWPTRGLPGSEADPGRMRCNDDDDDISPCWPRPDKDEPAPACSVGPSAALQATASSWVGVSLKPRTVLLTGWGLCAAEELNTSCTSLAELGPGPSAERSAGVLPGR